MTSTVLLKLGKNGVATYVPKEIILKEMAATTQYIMSKFLF
jgi:hypothetical protein